MTTYKKLIEAVSNGERFRVDFRTKTIRIGKRKPIHCDECDNLMDFDGDVIDEVERLYEEYKHSVPSERSESARQYYFKALPVNELTDEQLILGERREIARAKLEGFVLCAFLKGFRWLGEDKWFWQGSDKDLIIIKNWFE